MAFNTSNKKLTKVEMLELIEVVWDTAILDKIRWTIAEQDKHFGNARYVRNLFGSIIQHQANRVSTIPNPTQEQLSIIEVGDVLGVVRKKGKLLKN